MLKHESRVKLVTKNDCNGHEINGFLHPSFACCVEFSSLVLMLRIGLPTTTVLNSKGIQSLYIFCLGRIKNTAD